MTDYDPNIDLLHSDLEENPFTPEERGEALIALYEEENR